MKKSDVPTCPGCSRHCPACSVRCKYGRIYFQKHPPEAVDGTKKRKWERHVAEGGLMWSLLTNGKKLKKALCRQKLTEAGLMSLLSDEEQSALFSALHKLGTAAEAALKK